MGNVALTRAEHRFRVWMYISAWMYAGSGLFFLIGGGLIVKFVNMASARLLPSLPLYPLPAASPEGKFWLALSLSMMAMITYICRAAYLDPRRNGRLVPILLLSKFCSSVFYMGFFIAYGHLANLVGFFTDGPLFLVTLILWLPAEAGGNFIDETEEDIIAAIGEALLPRGGAFEAGYADYRDRCIVDARKLVAAQYPATQIGARAMLRILDLSPVYLSLRPVTLRRLPVEKRMELLKRIEHHSFYGLRVMLTAVKLFVTLPFFNVEENSRAVGYLPAEVAE
jgi:hypothetical protein